MLAVEVIDLTTSPDNSVIVIDDDPQDAIESTSHNGIDPEKSLSKKKRKKRVKPQTREEVLDNGSNSTPISPKDTSAKDLSDSHPRGKKRKREDKEASQPNSSADFVKVDTSNSPVFTIDTVGHPLGNDFAMNYLSAQSSPKILHTDDGLLLPSHVSVVPNVSNAGTADAEETGGRSFSPVSDASGIDFLDDALALGVPRYFDGSTAVPKSHKACKRCGDNDHDFKDCPNTICLTCGARNEHGSRSCPILRYCFNCQGKGHLAKDCPRIGPTEGRRTSTRDCDRCGSPKHHTTNCPTLWRIYTYLNDGERDKILAEREGKRDLPFEEGGEGFIARDHWCYNCGQCGHLGDDCKEINSNYDRPEDYSAFGRYNCLTGPFASSSQSPRYERAPRPWELNEPTRGGIPLDAQEDIGRKGREKARKRAQEAQSRMEEEDPDDNVPDWFNGNRGKTREKPKSKSNPQKESGTSDSRRQPLVFRITSEKKDTRFENHRDSSRPSLLNRIDMKGEKEGGRTRDRISNQSRNRNRDTERDQDRGQGSHSNAPGRYKDRHRPNERRWKGGYDR